MDKGLAGLLGAIGALAVANPAHATSSAPVDVDAVMQVNSYADLLKPIPNAIAVRQALDARNSAEPAVTEATPEVLNIRYYRHHHHRYRRRYYHHHHHHHHHRGIRIGPIVIR